MELTVKNIPVNAKGQIKVLKNLYRIEKKREYQVNPTSWLIERFDGKLTDLQWSAFQGYENHVWDGTKDPFLTAANALKDGKNVAIESATGVGKSYIGARLAFWFLDSFPNSAVITTAPTKEQLLQVFWKEIAHSYPKFKKHHPDSEMITGQIRVNKNQIYNDVEGSDFDYSNRMISKVGKKVSGAESSVVFQGIHYIHQLFIFDEAPGIDHSIFTAAINTNTFVGEYIELPELEFKGIAINSILALGNPDSVTDPLHTFSKRENTVSIRVSAYDHPNVVLKKPIIPGAVTVQSLEIRRQEYGENSNLFRSRGRGIAPEQATDALILRSWFYQCCRHRKEFAEDKFKEDALSFNAVGVDVANSLDGDKAATAWGKTNHLVDLNEFKCPNATDLADNLVKDSLQLKAEKLNDYNTRKIGDFGIRGENLGVDGVGIGVATVNQLTRLGIKNVRSLMGGSDESAIPKMREDPNDIRSELKPLYKFANLRAQMYYQLRLDLQHVDLSIDIDDLVLLELIADELTSIQYKTTDNAIIIEKKEDIKKRMQGKSPNKADCLVYWNWVRKRRTGEYRGEKPAGFMPDPLEMAEHQQGIDDAPGVTVPGIFKIERFIR